LYEFIINVKGIDIYTAVFVRIRITSERNNAYYIRYENVN